MPREQLPDRRPAITQKVAWDRPNKDPIHLLVTFGLTEDHQHVREIFCADFKAGSDYHGIIIDACIMASLLIQHNVPVADLATKLTQPSTIIGVLIGAAAKADLELRG